MARNDFIEQLVGQASGLLGASGVQQDIENKLRVMLQGAFNRLDLVSRDEFEAQRAVLARTRSKLEALEQQVADLSAQLDQRSS